MKTQMKTQSLITQVGDEDKIRIWRLDDQQLIQHQLLKNHVWGQITAVHLAQADPLLSTCTLLLFAGTGHGYIIWTWLNLDMAE